MNASVIRFVVLPSVLLTLAACGDKAQPSAPQAASTRPAAAGTELENLRAEVTRLRAENERLRVTPAGLAAEIDGALADGSAEKAASALKQLADRFPESTEAAGAGKRVQVFLAKRLAEDEEAKRLAALGFKGLKINPVFGYGDISIALSDTAVAKRWIFDSYGPGWRFTDAERGQKFLITRVAVNAKTKDPLLPGVGAYVADGAKLVRLGNMRYRFTRWQDYGAFLGTRADFRNEFSHSPRVVFTTAVGVKEEELKRRPIYLVATREGCHKRFYERFGQPPHFYLPEGPCASLKPTLALEDFKDGTLAVLKRLD